MIGKISGRVDYVADDHVLLEAAGVGYMIYTTRATLMALPSPGEPAALYTELVVREDLLQLFGFRTLAEREWHKLLTSVQGVGAKASLAILDALGAAGVGRALAAEDANAVRAAPGVGPKLATRIVTELRGKAPEVLAARVSGSQAAMPVDGHGGAVPSAGAVAPMAARPSPEDTAQEATGDALSALVNLGYDRIEAARAVTDAGEGSAEELIRRALQSLAREL
ncbi:MAG: Holliday junction branch migration protein RuvA [Pseudomonadota bacterium]